MLACDVDNTETCGGAEGSGVVTWWQTIPKGDVSACEYCEHTYMLLGIARILTTDSCEWNCYVACGVAWVDRLASGAKCVAMTESAGSGRHCILVCGA